MSDNLFEEESFTISLSNEYILDIYIKDFKELEKKDIIKMQEWVVKNTNTRPLFNLAQFGNGSSATREAREYASSKEGNTLTVGSALIVKNLAQQLIMDYYIKFNNPIYPTRVFFRREKAIKWINKQFENYKAQ